MSTQSPMLQGLNKVSPDSQGLIWPLCQPSQHRVNMVPQANFISSISENTIICSPIKQPSSTQPTAPQEYSGGEADRVWSGAYHTIPPFFISEWSLSALDLHRCPPWHPIVARLDPRSWPALTLAPRAWSALALNRGPPWLPIVVRLDPRFWPALTCYGRPLRNSKQE